MKDEHYLSIGAPYIKNSVLSVPFSLVNRILVSWGLGFHGKRHGKDIYNDLQGAHALFGVCAECDLLDDPRKGSDCFYELSYYRVFLVRRSC